MRVRKLLIEGFRGIRRGEFVFGEHAVLVGPNGSGKSSVVDALSLVFARNRLVRPLTENDFSGGAPSERDRIRIVVTLSGFPHTDAEHNDGWFRHGRAVPKWIDGDGRVHATEGGGRDLCAELAFVARFDHEDLFVETERYFHDADDGIDPFSSDAPVERFPQQLMNEVGFFVLPARRTWEASASFNSDLFRKVVSDVAGIPAVEILAQRDQLRAPEHAIDESPRLVNLVGRLNERLNRLLPSQPKFKLRLTAGDSEAVLQALLPHYATEGVTLPASRHGTGLVSLQSLLLLLEVGKTRKEKGLSFILAMEEPELHLAPGLQVRLVSEAMGLADQTICTTHSPRVAALFEPTSTLIMNLSAGNSEAKPFLATPLATTATNNERKLYLHNQQRVIDALMHPRVLIPEGRLDALWLGRLADIGEEHQSHPPFTSVLGIVPTENAAVSFTVQRLRGIRPGIIALVDGDGAGDRYVTELASGSPAPQIVIQWPAGWAIEDVIGWVLEANSAALASVEREVGAGTTYADVRTFIEILKTKPDRQSGQVGLKDDEVAHAEIAAVLKESQACARRAGEVLDAVVCASLGQPHARIESVAGPVAGVAHVRFKPL